MGHVLGCLMFYLFRFDSYQMGVNCPSLLCGEYCDRSKLYCFLSLNVPCDGLNIFANCVFDILFFQTVPAVHLAFVMFSDII